MVGLYWGYTVRGARDLSEVFTGSAFKEGYDLTIGTSEKVKPVLWIRNNLFRIQIRIL